MVRTAILGGGLAAALMGLGGCAALNPWGAVLSEDEPVSFPITSPVAVDVDSFNGDVIVTADPRLTVARIILRREATHGFGRKKEAKASLAQIDYSVSTAPRGMGQILEVRTWTTHAEPHFQRAHLEIRVPAVNGITVRTHNGSVHAIDIEGTVDIETSGGDVRVMSNLPLRQSVTVRNLGGDIDYRVRAESTAALDCQAIGGEVDYRVRYGRLIVHNVARDSLAATLNDGRNPVRLYTEEGDVRVAVVADPTDVGVMIVDP